MGLQRKDGGGWLLEHRGDDGITSLVGLIHVEPGYEAAIAAAMGPAADAVVAHSLDSARSAVTALADQDGGRASLIVSGEPAIKREAEIAPGSRPAVDVIDCPDELRAGLTAILDGVVLVETLDDAIRVVADHKGIRAVTRSGDLHGSGG